MWGLSPIHLLIILVIVLIVVGPGKLPETGAAIGKALRGFKDALEGVDQPSQAQQQVQQPPQAPVQYQAAPPVPQQPQTPYMPPVSPSQDPTAAQGQEPPRQ